MIILGFILVIVGFITMMVSDAYHTDFGTCVGERNWGIFILITGVILSVIGIMVEGKL